MQRSSLAALGGAVVLALAAGTGPAMAHAFLKSAVPGAGSSGPAPTQVAITFTEEVEPRFSTIAVLDGAGHRMETGAAHLDGDATHLAVAVKTLPPGVYKVVWHATATDTHKTQGSYRFTVTP